MLGADVGEGHAARLHPAAEAVAVTGGAGDGDGLGILLRLGGLTGDGKGGAVQAGPAAGFGGGEAVALCGVRAAPVAAGGNVRKEGEFPLFLESSTVFFSFATNTTVQKTQAHFH